MSRQLIWKHWMNYNLPLTKLSYLHHRLYPVLSERGENVYKAGTELQETGS